MLMTPEERWDRLATGLKWTTGLFAAFTAYGIYSGDDWRGVVMTAVPGAIVGLLAYLAAARRDRLIHGTESTLGARIAVIAGFVIMAGGATLWVLTRSEEIDRRQRADELGAEPVHLDLTTCEREVTLASGQKAVLPTLCRRDEGAPGSFQLQPARDPDGEPQ